MAGYDAYDSKVIAVDQPVRKAVPITPDDDNDLNLVCRSLYIGTQGDVTVIMAGDESNTPVLWAGLIGFAPMMIKRLMASGTDADNILALY